ncbi:TonB-dependent receptor [Aliiglaciecola sp. 2_MG-2023]|uniref:TonB-dependent receptor n=1 Tax=unclassified Aliiglaciecola TaxID=2593648 RepID=UPI0026E41266|nr:MULTISPECIES: TonB-dependent receptor [unclassified Aliiglaciecola]MDO6711593.1 TonB-dependent receptor [Aliiglaciecola sp. 2_MG-2023]MDO6752664.1 TonB-dependent receptor [Aliiglaciecola sp. 1_MG-2023]
MQIKYRKKPIAIYISALLMGYSVNSIAQETKDTNSELSLEVIEVTAQKRSQGLQDVPISISAISGDMLKNTNINSLTDMSSSVPNLTITKSGITNQIGIRGISSGGNKGFEQSVAMYVDEVYYGRDQLIQLPLVDLERVEILRGPQPILFGKNAIAGAISLSSARPTDEFEASISTLYEFEQEEFKTVGIISGPLTENLKGRFVASYREMDGWIENTTLERTEPNTKQLYLRGMLEWDYDDLNILLKAETANFDTAGRAIENHSPIGTYSSIFSGALYVETDEDYKSQNNGQESDNKVENVMLKVEYEVNDFTLTSTSAYLKYDTDELIDVDYTGLDLFNGSVQGERFKQWSQELRVASPTDGDIDYIAGIYLQDNELITYDNVLFGSTFAANPAFVPIVNGSWDRDFSQDSQVFSAFAQLNWRITDKLSLTAGARYSKEEKDAHRVLNLPGENTSGIPADALFPGSPAFGPQAGFEVMMGAIKIYAHDLEGTRKESQLDPLLNIQYELDDDTMFYASYTQGSKGGGFDIRSNSYPDNPVNPGSFEFEDEQATSYEIGGKFGFGYIEINAATFFTHYEDLQVTQFDGTVGFNVQNAAEAETKGIELDGRWLLSESLVLNASLAYLNFEYLDFDVAQCAPDLVLPDQVLSSSVDGLCNLAGESAIYTPELTGSLRLQYQQDLGDWAYLTYGLNMEYSDKYNAGVTIDPNTEQDAYTRWGVRVALADYDDQWKVALIANNITDERVMTLSNSLPFSTTLTGGTGVAYYGIYDRPRSIALELTYNF